MTLFRHYKGEMYEMVCSAFREEDELSMIVYRSVDTGRIWVRPTDEFCGKVQTAGGMVDRFEKVPQ